MTIRVQLTVSTAVYELRLYRCQEREITIPVVVEVILKDIANGVTEERENRIAYARAVLEMCSLSPKGSQILKEDAAWCLTNIVDIQ